MFKGGGVKKMFSLIMATDKFDKEKAIQQYSYKKSDNDLRPIKTITRFSS